MSVESMLNQTVSPNEIVIVKDGPLTEELEQVIEALQINPVIRFLSLERNGGLGRALQLGLLNCRHEYIARMDTDDISVADRCQKQLECFARDPDLSVVGTTVREFTDEPNETISLRRVPMSHEDIVEFLKTRNPFNHPSVMFKKDAVLRAGNYQPWHLNEDYYLWVRMAQGECKFANIYEPLLNMRITKGTYVRRGGLGYLIAQERLFRYMLQIGMITRNQYLYNNAVRFVVCLLLPSQARKWLYLRFLRTKQEKSLQNTILSPMDR